MISRGQWLRILVVSAAMTAVMAGLCMRLAFLHLGYKDDLRETIQRMRHSELNIRAERGRILDRNRNILALDLPVKDVWVDPARIAENGHADFIAQHLSRLLQLDPAFVASRIQRPDRRFEYVKRFVPRDTAEQIRRMQLTGVHFDEVTARNYPHGSLMSHVIGFSNFDGVGSAGVEQKMNSYLSGRSGLRVSERDGRRSEIYNRRSLVVDPQHGADIYLTMDQNLQFMVEESLDRALDQYNAKSAWAIIQRVNTGEILAMASRPTFDPNEFRFTQDDERRNRAVSVNFEPGSTFKSLVIAAALNEGVVSPDDRFDCEHGRWVYGGRPLHDYRPHGILTVEEILKKSSNIGAAKIALKLGNDRLEEYLRDFGIGSLTGIDLPAEEAGILSPHSRWSRISATRIAMGHEVAVTALQLLNAVNSIANGGLLMRPYVVNEVIDARGRVIFEMEPEVLARPIEEETALTMMRLMERVTEEGGTGFNAAMDSYRVAGKTGTAQKPVPGGYSDRANIASFIGFLPDDRPEIGMIVVLDEPQPVRTGGATAAPVFKDIADQAVRYLGIAPDGAVVSADINPAR